MKESYQILDTEIGHLKETVDRAYSAIWIEMEAGNSMLMNIDHGNILNILQKIFNS